MGNIPSSRFMGSMAAAVEVEKEEEGIFVYIEG